MSDIPKAREELEELAMMMEQLGKHSLAQKLRDIVEQYMVRNKPVRRTPVASDKVDKKIARQVREYAKVHPKMSMARMGAIFNLNPGRISEILNGKRNP